MSPLGLAQLCIGKEKGRRRAALFHSLLVAQRFSVGRFPSLSSIQPRQLWLGLFGIAVAAVYLLHLSTDKIRSLKLRYDKHVEQASSVAFILAGRSVQIL